MFNLPPTETRQICGIKEAMSRTINNWFVTSDIVTRWTSRVFLAEWSQSRELNVIWRG